jgi:signal recognition particle GTPase
MAKKQASNRREESARKKRERENKANEIVKRQRSGNKPNMNMNRVVNKPNTNMNRVVNKPNTNMNRVVNKPNTNMNRVVKVVPKMENFDLFLRAGNVNNETIKGLLNKIIRNQKSFNTRQKPKIRNVLNKILRRSNQPQNLNSVALQLKARMFPSNNRQLRSRVVRN